MSTLIPMPGKKMSTNKCRKVQQDTGDFGLTFLNSTGETETEDGKELHCEVRP